MIVSADGITVSTASYDCSAATLASMMSWDSSGRTASCSSTKQSSSPESPLSASSAARVVSLRVPDPSRIRVTLV
jgi:hypothetical protein